MYCASIFCDLFMYFYCFVVVLLSCYFVVVLCIFIFVCTSVGLLPPGESQIAVSNNNKNQNFNLIF